MKQFHLLVIRLSSMGDVILPTGLLALIKKTYGPKIRISFLTSEEFAPLIHGLPFIDQVIVFRRRQEDLSQLIVKLMKLRKENPIDLIFDLHSTIRSLLIRLRFCMIPRLVVDKRRIERFLLTKFKINLLQKDGAAHAQVERLIEDFKTFFALDNDKQALSDYLHQFSSNHSKQKSLSMSAFAINQNPLDLGKWGMDNKELICFFPSASFAPKRWPVSSFIQLIEKLIQDEKYQNTNFAILAGPKDDFCQQFDSLTMAHPKRVYNL